MRPMLRVYDVTFVDPRGSNTALSFDVEVPRDAESWYVNVGRPAATYCAEIGLRTPTGRFLPLLRSNTAATPRATPAADREVRWLEFGPTGPAWSAEQRPLRPAAPSRPATSCSLPETDRRMAGGSLSSFCTRICRSCVIRRTRTSSRSAGSSRPSPRPTPAPRDVRGPRSRPRPHAPHAVAQPAAARPCSPTRCSRHATSATSIGWSSWPRRRSAAPGPSRASSLAEMYLARFYRARAPCSSTSGSRPRRRLPRLPAARPRRGHHLRRDARVPAAARHRRGRRPRADRRGGGGAPAPLRPRRPPASGCRECGYVPGVDGAARGPASATSSSTRTASRSRRPRPVYGVYAPSSAPGRRRVRPRHRAAKQVWSAKEGYPGDPLPRLLSRHRLRPDLDYIARTSTPTATASTPASSTTASRHQTRRQVALRPRSRARAGRRPRRRTSRRAPARRWRGSRARWTGRRSSCARTTPSSTATGGSRGRCSSSTCSAGSPTTRTSGAARPATTSRAARRPAGDAGRVELGRSGHYEYWLDAAERLGAIATCTPRPNACRRSAVPPERRRAHAPRAHPGRARAAARAGERLDVLMARDATSEYATRRTRDHLLRCQRLCAEVEQRRHQRARASRRSRTPTTSFRRSITAFSCNSALVTRERLP